MTLFTATIVFMPLKHCVRLIPRVEGFHYGYGGTLFTGGAYDVNVNESVPEAELMFHEFKLTISFSEYTGTRQMSDAQQVIIFSFYFSSYFLLLWKQNIRFRARFHNFDIFVFIFALIRGP